jgi:hypothetical protein
MRPSRRLDSTSDPTHRTSTRPIFDGPILLWMQASPTGARLDGGGLIGEQM